MFKPFVQKYVQFATPRGTSASDSPIQTYEIEFELRKRITISEARRIYIYYLNQWIKTSSLLYYINETDTIIHDLNQDPHLRRKICLRSSQDFVKDYKVVLSQESILFYDKYKYNLRDKKKRLRYRYSVPLGDFKLDLTYYISGKDISDYDPDFNPLLLSYDDNFEVSAELEYQGSDLNYDTEKKMFDAVDKLNSI